MTSGARRWLLPALLVLISLPWAWVAFTPEKAIQWDASGYFYPYQKCFSDAVRDGRLPLWTSGLFSGFPLLADMQVGAWYPLNWPFFLAGVTPRAIFLELWLHALLAGFGAWLLALYLFENAEAALFAGLVYGLAGFFSAHAQHVCLFQAAAWLPLLVWLLLVAVERRSNRALAGAILAGGAVCLAGHFQTTLYAFTAVGLCGLTLLVESRGRNWRRVLAVLLLIAVGSALLSAVQVLPSAELVARSLRARLDAGQFTGGILTWRSLGTFLFAPATGAFEAEYNGPQDMTQHYFFAGTLLIPLALGGLFAAGRKRLWLVLALVVPALWYSVGPAGGLYWLLLRVSGFASVRAPSHSMFVVTIGLALSAAAAIARLKRRWMVVVICLMTAAELYYWNFGRSRMVYAREDFAVTEARRERWLSEMARLPLAPGTRLATPERWAGVEFGAKQFQLETTFGSNALMPARYFDYLDATIHNYLLLSGLGVSRYFDPKEWKTHDWSPALPRFYAPGEVKTVTSEEEARRGLETLDPARTVLRVGRRLGVEPNGQAEVKMLVFSEERYEAEVRAGSASLLRIAVPEYPGWRATLDGRPLGIERVDHALMGVSIPPGHHRLVVSYRQNYLAGGAMLSLATLAGVGLLFWRSPRR